MICCIPEITLRLVRAYTRQELGGPAWSGLQQAPAAKTEDSNIFKAKAPDVPEENRWQNPLKIPFLLLNCSAKFCADHAHSPIDGQKPFSS